MESWMSAGRLDQSLVPRGRLEPARRTRVGRVTLRRDLCLGRSLTLQEWETFSPIALPHHTFKNLYLQKASRKSIQEAGICRFVWYN